MAPRAAIALLCLAALAAGCGGGVPERAAEDLFAYDAAHPERYERRAAAGLAHPLFAHSPGGVEATARRVARYRPLVEATADGVGVDPDTFEALIFLESGGLPDARAGGTEGAVGLTQILAQTATGLLGMRVDVQRSRELTRAIARGGPRTEARRRERRRIDERYDPVEAIAATGRYLTFALEKLGREDLAFVSYHMGVGNLQGALAAYGERDIPYAQLYFDSSPLRHPEAWARLASLGDDSSTYLWRVYAARDIMRLWRGDPDRLAELAAAQLAKNSAEEVLHPLDERGVLADPEAVARARSAGELAALEPGTLAQAGLAVAPQMGELAPRLGAEPSLYRALRPEALRVLLAVGAKVREISGADAPLTVTSTVRDARYQALLVRGNDQATRRYSLHTVGWAFDVRRRYSGREQAAAFQFVLDRLTALNRIAWVREPGAIHVTAAGP